MEVAGEFKIGVDRLPDGVDVLIVDVDGLEHQIVKEIVSRTCARLPPILMVEHHDLCDVTRWVDRHVPPELAGKPINGFSFQSTSMLSSGFVLDHYETHRRHAGQARSTCAETVGRGVGDVLLVQNARVINRRHLRLC